MPSSSPDGPAGEMTGEGVAEADRMPPVPVLETERLILRGHRRTDFEDSAALWAEPDVVRHIGGRPFSREQSWSRFLRYVGLWPVLGFGYWVARERTGGGFVGEVGLADFKRDVDPPLGDVPEVGWVLAPASHGKGYATEAVKAVLAWADVHLRASRTICIINADNLPSLRVAGKCGFREQARINFLGQPTILLQRRGGAASQV